MPKSPSPTYGVIFRLTSLFTTLEKNFFKRPFLCELFAFYPQGSRGIKSRTIIVYVFCFLLHPLHVWQIPHPKAFLHSIHSPYEYYESFFKQITKKKEDEKSLNPSKTRLF